MKLLEQRSGVVSPAQINGRYVMFYLGTDQGLLLVYNGWNVDQVHCTGAVLLDPQNPRRILARSAEPILAPQEPWELSGYVPNVIFSEGLTQQGDVWHLYYGGADRVIGLATCSQEALPAFDEE